LRENKGREGPGENETEEEKKKRRKDTYGSQIPLHFVVRISRTRGNAHGEAEKAAAQTTISNAVITCTDTALGPDNTTN
jgi:hypothetical protein